MEHSHSVYEMTRDCTERCVTVCKGIARKFHPSTIQVIDHSSHFCFFCLLYYSNIFKLHELHLYILFFPMGLTILILKIDPCHQVRTFTKSNSSLHTGRRPCRLMSIQISVSFCIIVTGWGCVGSLHVWKARLETSVKLTLSSCPLLSSSGALIICSHPSLFEGDQYPEPCVNGTILVVSHRRNEKLLVFCE